MKVLIAPRGSTSYDLDQVERVRSKGLDVHYNATGKVYTHEEFKALAKDAGAIIIGVDKMDREMMEGCSSLKAVYRFGVGADNIDLDYAKEHSIYVGCCVGGSSRSVAEHILSMMFMEAKNLYTSVRDVKHRGWNKLTGEEIYGKKLGIIGFGMIGKYLTEYAYNCGMEVYAYNTFAIAEETARQYHAQTSTLEGILTDYDYISLHVPLLRSTRNMISTKEFKKMKEDACLLGAARGGIVNGEALYEVLKKKEIQSACFDVYGNEPLREDGKLLTLDNFLLVPHTAARGMESEQRTCAVSTDIILERLIGSQVNI